MCKNHYLLKTPQHCLPFGSFGCPLDACRGPCLCLWPASCLPPSWPVARCPIWMVPGLWVAPNPRPLDPALWWPSGLHACCTISNETNCPQSDKRSISIWIHLRKFWSRCLVRCGRRRCRLPVWSAMAAPSPRVAVLA